MKDYTTKEFFKAILGIKSQAGDIFEHFGAVPHFDAWVEQNEFGGNPSYFVELSIDWKVPMKKVKFTYHLAAMTLKEFENEIKSYLYDCVDTFINL